MEIEQLRKELTHLLENIIGHSNAFSEGKQIPPLEIGVVLAKINKMQEKLIVLRYLIESKEQEKKEPVKINVKEETAIPVVKNAVVTEVKEIAIKAVQPELVIAIKEEISTPKESKTTSSVADQIQHAPINKLVDAFTLNDRYLYANELFNKDMSAFNALIKEVDACNTFDEAQTLFNQAGVKFDWDVENQLVLEFMNLIERRFL